MYNHAQQQFLQRELKQFQRVMMHDGKRGQTYKVRSRYNRRINGPVYDVLLCDTTRDGRDSSLGDPVVVGGPFLSLEEADAFARDQACGKRVFHFAGIKFTR